MMKLNQTFGNAAYGAFSDSNNYATETNNFGETAFGILNKSTIDPDNFTSKDVVKSSKATLFSIGNGTDEQRRNVIEIKGNGDVYINGVAGYQGTDTDQAGNIAEEFQGVHDSIDELERRADETDVEIGEINQHLDNVDSTLESIHMQKDDASDLVYTLVVDGEERGTINIPKDQFLKDVDYDPDTKELVFIFVTSDENDKEVRVNIENLVDVYSAGNGLSLTNSQFAIKLDPSTESYITVGADGLKISGLDSKFDTLSQKDTEQDNRIQTAETDIDALQSDLSALKGDGEGSIGDQIQTAVDALKGGVSESYDTLKKIEDNVVSTNDKFDEYLPLTGGTINGPLVVSDHILWLYGDIKNSPPKLQFNTGGSGGITLGYNENGFYIGSPNSGIIINHAETDPSLDVIFSDNHEGYISLHNVSDNRRVDISPEGVSVTGKTSSDLLHAAGGTTILKTINNTSLLGSGDINLPTITDIQDITGSNTYTGTNYISKEANLTDAVMQLDEEIKAANDNIDLEHANAEATYVKKAGDTITGDLTVPNITANGNITSTKFIGPLQGNADTATSATKAFQDGYGNVIADTYATEIDLSKCATKEELEGFWKLNESITSRANIPTSGELINLQVFDIVQFNYLGDHVYLASNLGTGSNAYPLFGLSSTDTEFNVNYNNFVVIGYAYNQQEVDTNHYGVVEIDLMSDIASDEGSQAGLYMGVRGGFHNLPNPKAIKYGLDGVVIYGKTSSDLLHAAGGTVSIQDIIEQVPTPDLSSKQDVLVSGTNIKTIGGETILGSGNFDIATESDITDLFN